MISLGTLLFTAAKGRMVGIDQSGNRYYTEKRSPKGRPARRWVMFKGAVEASRIPPEWHAWLHYTADEPLSGTNRPAWVQPHQANVTGTPGAYLPPGHDLRGGHRQRATGDYEAWRP